MPFSLDRATKSLHEIQSVAETRDQDLVKDEPGLYTFWWLGDKTDLTQSNREIALSGPKGGRKVVTLEDWWKDLAYPCLYVGKSTRLKTRFRQHLLPETPALQTTDIGPDNHKQEPRTTSCQLRHGIEHIFKNEKNPLDLIMQHVGYSFYPTNDLLERFYGENFLIGTWLPWFNVDSER